MEVDFLKKPEVFILDDSFEHIKYISGFLMKNNYCVRAATNVESFFENINKSLPDIILLDIMLPEDNGFNICEKLKNDEYTKELPVIFLTSLEDNESTIKGFEKGAQDYIQKPVDLNILLARVNTHVKLKQKTEKLREAYRDIENFNHMVGHDLKSPLWSIKNLAEFVYDECYNSVGKETAEFLNGIKQKSEEAVILIDKLSELSKISNNTLNLEKVKLNEIFNESFDELSENKKNSIVQMKVDNLKTVYGDRILLKQVVKNILSNAIKFTQNCEKPKIIVNDYVDRNEMVIKVKDNGVGFDMKYSKKIFNMFQRLHSSEDYEGMGAGLSIAKRIIQKHGGKIWIESKENIGTEVSFSIPIKY